MGGIAFPLPTQESNMIVCRADHIVAHVLSVKGMIAAVEGLH